MPRIPAETIDEIRRRADIVSVVETYVQLQKRNNEFWGCCPFHQEKTPSFKLSPAYQTYHCFGCGTGGNVFQFIMEKENVDFPGAATLLAERFNVIIPEPSRQENTNPENKSDRRQRARHKETLFACLKQIAEWYQQLLTRKEASTARQYLKERGLDQEAIEKFGLGFALDSWDAALKWGDRYGFPLETMLECGLVIQRENDRSTRVYDRFRNRIMFPIRDELGRVVGFSGRAMEEDTGTAKYINTPETTLFQKGKLLYGLDLARGNLKKHGFALVCEGQLDVIACHRSGFDNALAPQGTAFTENQARLLKRFTPAVTFAFDSDPAGLQAAAKSIGIALRMELKPQTVTLPENEDPDSIFQARGGDELKTILQSGEDAMEFLFRFACRTDNPQTAQGKDAIASFLINIFSDHPSAVLRSAYCQWLGRRLEVPEEAIYEMLNRHLRKTAAYQRRETSSDSDGQLPVRNIKQQSMTGSQLETAILNLLDLALYHAPLAQQLTEKLNREFLGHNPAAKALNLVLDETENGRHTEAGNKLAAEQTLVVEHRISRILAGSLYPEPPTETESRQKQREQIEGLLQRALDDCLAVIEFNNLDRILQELDREIENEKDPGLQREKLLEYQKLVQRSRQLNKVKK